MLLRFADDMQPGAIVICPYKSDSTLNFGRIESDYHHEPSAPLHHHRRKVNWMKTGVPRSSPRARYEIGSAVTLFRLTDGGPTKRGAAQKPTFSVWPPNVEK